MAKELHVFEPTRADEYIRILRVRVGYVAMEKNISETLEFLNQTFVLFGTEWASSHNRKAIQNIFDRIIEDCEPGEHGHGIFKNKIPEFAKMDVLNFAFDVFKCAWINADEYLPESKHEIKKNHKREKK